MDLRHPSVLEYALEIGLTREQLLFGTRDHGRPRLMVTETGATVAGLAAHLGVSLSDAQELVAGELAPAVVPAAHLAAEAFAKLSGATTEEIATAAHGELAEALTPAGRLDISHPATLTWLAGRPIRKGERLDGILGPACVGDDVDMAHPLAIAMLARSWGRVPTSADFDAATAARK
jgi:hypothetical protein